MSNLTLPATITPQVLIPALPSERELGMIERLARIEYTSGLLPKVINSPEKAITIALKARELGVPMMYGFSHVYVIDGKPSISAELMLNLGYRNIPGLKIMIDSQSDYCEIHGQRPGGSTMRVLWSLEDAKRAGLVTKDNWKKYPRAMLRARAVSEIARSLFPDAISGCSYTPEELNSDLQVNEDGEPVMHDVKSEVVTAQEVNQVLGIEAPNNVVPIEKKTPTPVPTLTKSELTQKLLSVHKLFATWFPKVNMPALIQGRYGVGESKLMTAEQLLDLIVYMESELERVNGDKKL